MKKTFTIFALALMAAFTVSAETFTVSNNPEIPAQFTQITDAIASGNTHAGDTLLVAGSPTTYTGFTLNEPFVIIGAGIHNPHGYNTQVGSSSLSNTAGFSPSGSKLSGLIFTYSLTLNGDLGTHVLENVTIERCQMWYVVHFSGGNSNFNNDTIRNCIFQNSDINFTDASYSGVLLSNNLFDNYYIDQGTGADLSNVTLLNNVFINRQGNVFDAIHNIVVENNIFFKSSPRGCNGCVFDHNTAWGTLTDTLPYGDNLGNEFNEVRDPQFVDYNTSDAGFTWNANYDFHLQPSSDEIGTGKGSTDRGMYGGPSPVELGTNPSIPQMTEIIFTDNASSVKEDGTLNVKFKAKKQN